MLFDGNVVVFAQLRVRHGLEELAAADYPVLPSLDWCLVLQLCERHETGASLEVAVQSDKALPCSCAALKRSSLVGESV